MAMGKNRGNSREILKQTEIGGAQGRAIGVIMVDNDATASVRADSRKSCRNPDPLGLAIAMAADLLFSIKIIREQILASRCFPMTDDIAPGVAVQFRMATVGMMTKRCRNMARQGTAWPSATFQIMIVGHDPP